MANDQMLPGAIAYGNLSTSQFCVVRLTGSTIPGGFEVGLTTALTHRPVGILINDPNSSGQAADVVTSGVVKAHYGDTITIGQALTFNILGRVIPILIDTGTAINKAYVIGQSLEEGTSGTYHPILFHQPYIISSTA